LGAKNAAWDSLAADELRVEPWSLPLAVYHGRWLMNIATARRAQGGRGGAGAIVKSRRCNGLAKLSFSKYFDLARMRTPINRIDISGISLPAGDDAQVSEAHRPALEVGLAGLRWLRGGGLAAVASTVAAGGMSRRHCDANTRSWRPRAKVAMSLSG
jgi:hypothetical protein